MLEMATFIVSSQSWKEIAKSTLPNCTPSTTISYDERWKQDGRVLENMVSGVGYGKIQYFLEQQYGAGAPHMMKLTKQALDPSNIMNPGKVVDLYNS
jgi:hypothetical protein